jgi:hypothetical protein
VLVLSPSPLFLHRLCCRPIFFSAAAAASATDDANAAVVSEINNMERGSARKVQVIMRKFGHNRTMADIDYLTKYFGDNKFFKQVREEASPVGLLEPLLLLPPFFVCLTHSSTSSSRRSRGTSCSTQ